MGNKWELHKALPNWSHRGLSTYNVGNYCIRASPSVDDTNGFFVARFHRKVEDGDGGTSDVSQSDVTEEDTSDKIPFLLRPPSNDKKRKVTQPPLKVPVAKKIKR